MQALANERFVTPDDVADDVGVQQVVHGRRALAAASKGSVGDGPWARSASQRKSSGTCVVASSANSPDQSDGLLERRCRLGLS
jgi:hypothetical protein